MNDISRFGIILATTFLFIGSSTAFGFGGGFGGGSLSDSFESSVNDFADDVESGVEDATSEEAMREYSDTAGHITGDAVRESSEFLGEAGETMYREATDEQAQDFYKDTSEIAGEMSQEAYTEMTDQEAQNFYNSVLQDAKELSEDSYEAATSEEAKQFYNDAIEGTKYASEETYKELTDKEAKRFYRAAVKQAGETGAETWSELSDEEARKIYREAFATVQDVGKTVHATATSEEAKSFTQTTKILLEDGAEVTAENADQFVKDVTGISSYNSLINEARISEEQAKWVYRRAHKRADNLGEEMTDEEAREFYSSVMQDVKFAAELSQVFGESAYNAASEGRSIDWTENEIPENMVKTGIKEIRQKYVSDQITLKEAEKSSKLMKKAIKSSDSKIKNLNTDQVQKFYETVVNKAQKSSDSEITGEKVYNEAMENIVFGKTVSSRLENGDREFFQEGLNQLESKVLKSDLERKKARSAKDLLKEALGNTEESRKHLNLNDDERKSFYNYAVENAERVDSLNGENVYSSALKFVEWEKLDSRITESIAFEQSNELHKKIKSSEWSNSEQISGSLTPEELSPEQKSRFKQYIYTVSDFRAKDDDYSDEFTPEKISEVYRNAYNYAKGETSLPGGNGITGSFTRQSSSFFSSIF